MTNDEKLMQQALDALEEIIQGCHEVDDDDECIHKDAKDLARLVKIDCRKLANVLRARLAQGEVSYAGNGTAGRENMTSPTGFFFQMPKQPEPEPVACIVKDCENHKHEGGFIGDLCSPCHAFITRNEGKHSQAYRNTKRKRLAG